MLAKPAQTPRRLSIPLSLSALPCCWVRGHSMGYWHPWTGAPTGELMDITEQWHALGHTVTAFDEVHIRRLPPDAVVVEVGPGQGADLFVLSEVLPHGRIVVVEQCPEVLARLQKWFIGHGNLHFVQGWGLDSVELGSRRANYLRLVRVAPYFGDADLGRFLAKAEALLHDHGELMLTAYHPCAMEDPDPACGQGFGHHTAATLLQIVRWHCRLRPARLQLSVKELPTRTQRLLADLDLSDTPAEAIDERIRALVFAQGTTDGQAEAEVEMRLWFVKEPAGQPEL